MRPRHLETERLILRPLVRGDTDDILRMQLDPEVQRYSHISSQSLPKSLKRNSLRKEIQKQIVEQSLGTTFWAIEWSTRSGLLGQISLGMNNLRTNLSFLLLRENWGQGIATEAAQAVCAHAFLAQKLPEISALSHKDNRPSHRVLEKLGMKPDGIGIATTRQRSVLEMSKSPPSGSLLNINSTRGNLYVSYKLERLTYLALRTQSRDSESVPSGTQT